MSQYKLLEIFSVIILGLFILVPFLPNMPSSGLDPSWAMVIEKSFINNDQWGKDVIFTYGPLGFLQTKFYFERYFDLTVPIWFLISSIFIYFLYNSLKDTTLINRIFVYLLFISYYGLMGDSFYLFSISLTVIYGVYNKVSYQDMFLGAIILSIFSLTKTTFFIFSIGAVFLSTINVYRDSYLKSILNVLIFVIVYFFIYTICGQDITSWFSFVKNSLEIVLGFSSAMSIQGSSLEIIIFLFIMTIAIILFVMFLLKSSLDRVKQFVLISLLLALIFVNFKQGFVRHDLHSLSAWGGLLTSLMLMLICIKKGNNNKRHALMKFMYMFISFISFFIGVSLYESHLNLEKYNYIYDDVVKKYINKASFTFDLFFNGYEVKEQLDKKLNEIKNELANNSPIKKEYKLNGTIDVIDNIQGEIISSGLNYRNRPIIQEYSVYTKELQKINKEFFMSDRVDYILFKPGSIDGRLPTLAEGASYPIFFTHYKIEKIFNDSLLFKRLDYDQDKTISSKIIIDKSIEPNQKLSLPQGEFLFSTIKFNSSVLGKLVSLFYKKPIVKIRYHYNDGSIKDYRLVPGITSSGFYLSPVVNNSFDLLNNIVHPCFNNSCPNAFDIHVGDGFAPLLYRDIEVKIFKHELPDNIIEPEVLSYVNSVNESYILMSDLFNSSKVGPPLVNLSNNELFAHAPANLSIDVIDTKGKILDLIYGVKTEAIAKMHGVCFTIKSDDVVLMDNCILKDSKDNAENHIRLPLPVNTRKLYFDTTCLDSICDFSWSYWKSIKIVD
ncbi:hypothetical protein KW490_18315 [Vibrio fluvialis]|nr:hypothetical protein [Vibrio fluvialis]